MNSSSPRFRSNDKTGGNGRAKLVIFIVTLSDTPLKQEETEEQKHIETLALGTSNLTHVYLATAT